jgi:LAO/AO transport system kinase
VFSELAQLYQHAGRAYIIGFTGSPGVGKSSLVDKVVSRFRNQNKKVGVLAIDPTSPFTGGAILGDRIRMQKHFLDDGVFIRSMATRGQFGGLTRSTADAVVVLDAMGMEVIILETVGVGQDEVDIANSAHTTILVTVPGMGDDIQAIKAGLMEIGDIFVVNKADREGAGKTVRELRFMLQMSSERHTESGWVPPILETVAMEDRGVDDLMDQIALHREYLHMSGSQEVKQKEKIRIKSQIIELLKDKLLSTFFEKLGGDEKLEISVDDIIQKKVDPYTAVNILVDQFAGGKSH